MSWKKWQWAPFSTAVEAHFKGTINQIVSTWRLNRTQKQSCFCQLFVRCSLFTHTEYLLLLRETVTEGPKTAETKWNSLSDSSAVSDPNTSVTPENQEWKYTMKACGKHQRLAAAEKPTVILNHSTSTETLFSSKSAIMWCDKDGSWLDLPSLELG